MTNLSNKPPIWFWVVSVLALLWNAMGVMAYLVRAFATEEMIANLEPEQQAEFLIEYPAWVTGAFAIAVFSGILASICLLLRKKWAYSLFILSAVTAIAQHIYIFMNIDIQDYVMPVLIPIVCILLILFSKYSISKYWLK